jgi:hypothetical protein
MDPGALQLTIPAEMPLAQWKAAFGSYEGMAASARSRVIEEVYSRAPLDAPCFHAHENPRTFGKEPKGAHFVSGKDAAGRVVVSRYPDPGPFGSTIERFWLDRGDIEIGITFSWFTPKIPTAVCIRRLEGPKLIEQRTLNFQPGEALAGCSAEALARGSDRWERSWTVWAWEGDRVVARRDFASQLVSGGPPSYGSGARSAGRGQDTHALRHLDGDHDNRLRRAPVGLRARRPREGAQGHRSRAACRDPGVRVAHRWSPTEFLQPKIAMNASIFSVPQPFGSSQKVR